MSPTLADLHACDPQGDRLDETIAQLAARIIAGARLAERGVPLGCDKRPAAALVAELRPIAARLLEHATKLMRAVDAIDDAIHDYAASGSSAATTTTSGATP